MRILRLQRDLSQIGLHFHFHFHFLIFASSLLQFRLHLDSFRDYLRCYYIGYFFWNDASFCWFRWF
jgi:hypothetical protein